MQNPVLRCIGHRGAMGHEPENTLRSIGKALELGAHCIEVDVYQVEGHLVVIHDDRLERTTNGTGLVTEQSFEYLRTLDAGKGERIPTLAEVCELIQGRAGLNIELKGPGTTESVAQFIAGGIKSGWNKSALLVSSFSQQELLRLRALDSDLQLAVCCKAASPPELDFAESIHAASIHPAHKTVTAEFVQDAHTRGIRVFAYTVNEPDDIIRMAELGVDGVFTNYPERVLEHYAQGVGFW